MNYNSIDDILKSDGFIALDKSSSEEDGLDAMQNRIPINNLMLNYYLIIL